MKMHWSKWFGSPQHFDVSLLWVCENDDLFRTSLQPSYVYPSIGACDHHLSGIEKGIRINIWEGHWGQEGTRAHSLDPEQKVRVLRKIGKGRKAASEEVCSLETEPVEELAWRTAVITDKQLEASDYCIKRMEEKRRQKTSKSSQPSAARLAFETEETTY